MGGAEPPVLNRGGRRGRAAAGDPPPDCPDEVRFSLARKTAWGRGGERVQGPSVPVSRDASKGYGRCTKEKGSCLGRK
eukprot:9029890-Alexandrium_andersonii.AAC.1